MDLLLVKEFQLLKHSLNFISQVLETQMVKFSFDKEKHLFGSVLSAR